MCKKTLNENSEHIFVKCELAENFFDFIKNAYLDKKELQNSLVLLKFKRDVTERDYKILSCYVYCVWRVAFGKMTKYTKMYPKLVNFEWR
jgi:hypothetical protein